jgi:hypothetical protein
MRMRLNRNNSTFGCIIQLPMKGGFNASFFYDQRSCLQLLLI